MRKRIFLVIMGIFCVSLMGARFDPTRPPNYKDPDTKVIRKKDLSVTAIIISKAHRVAVINDYVVGIGDEILGLKIIGIEKNEVRFYGHEGYFSVPLHAVIKQEHS